MKRFIMLPLTALAISGCADKPKEIVVKEKMMEYQAKQIDTQLSQMPDWYTKIPNSDDAVFAVGTSVTPDMQMSIDIATLSAKTTLADRIDSKLRSQLKTFKSKLGATDFDNQLAHEFEQATINVIADADVAGYNVKETAIVQHGTQYQAYVLLEYTDGEAAKIIRNRVAKEKMLLSKLMSTKAFKDLDERVDNINKTDLEEMDIVVDAINGVQSSETVVE